MISCCEIEKVIVSSCNYSTSVITFFVRLSLSLSEFLFYCLAETLNTPESLQMLKNIIIRRSITQQVDTWEQEKEGFMNTIKLNN
jgi:hypothetical protein